MYLIRMTVDPYNHVSFRVHMPIRPDFLSNNLSIRSFFWAMYHTVV